MPLPSPQPTQATEAISCNPVAWDAAEPAHKLQSDSSWLISFIDILTILLTVFVLLLAYDEHQPVADSAIEPMTEIERKNPLPEPVSADTSETPSGELTQLIATLQSQFDDTLAIEINHESIKLNIEDRVMFSPASAELTAEGRRYLEELAGTLVTLPYLISVEGHTDNSPIHSQRYPTNWELSAARATIVTRTLIEHGIAAERLRAIGYGDTQPLVANSDATGKAQNRRVSFVLELPAS